MAKILVIEDDISIRKILSFELESKEHDVTTLVDGIEAVETIINEEFDLVLVDWMLPYKDGITIIKEVRAQGYLKPIIILTAKSEEEDIILGLEAGADDYLTKPFHLTTLMARINAHLRRYFKHFQDNTQIGNITLDTKKREVKVEEDVVLLTKVEFDLLQVFMANEDVALTRQDLLKKIWDFDYDGDTRLVDIHVFKLKTKLSASNVLFKSVRGVGYKLIVEGK